MRRIFKPDVLAIALGPVLILAIVLGFDTFIYEADKLRWPVFGYAAAGLVVVCASALLLFRRRARVHRDEADVAARSEPSSTE